MPRRHTFRKINSSNLGWHWDLGEGENRENFADWLEFDGQLEGGYEYSGGLNIGIIPHLKEEGERRFWPSAHLSISTPDGKRREVDEFYPPKDVETEIFGGVWGPNTFKGKLGPDGQPEGYHLKISIGDIGADLTARAVNTGLVFTDEEHGYSYYSPTKKTALGWWPLVPRAEVEGTLTIDGKPVKVKGLGYVERQLTNMPTSFGGGGQTWWTWGHFYCGDYTAIWTDSASSEHFGYRHFTPFVLWKGGDIVLSTFQFTSYVEKFGIEPELGYLYPVVESLKASDGNVEFRAQILPGRVTGIMKLVTTGGTYVRQMSPLRMQLRRWDEVEEVASVAPPEGAIHEFGGGADWFPFEMLGAGPELPKRVK